MDEVLELAAKLSKALARSKRFMDLRSAESAVMADEAAVALIQKRDELHVVIAEKEKSGAPIEPEDKRGLAAADVAVKTNTVLANLNRAQADFQEMLYLVNQEITSALEPAPEKKPEQSATEEDATEADATEETKSEETKSEEEQTGE